MARGRQVIRQGWWSEAPWWAWVGMIVGALVLAVGTPIALSRDAVPLPQAELDRMAAARAATADVETPALLEVTVTDAMALLDQADREWTMTVLGDSTGNGGDEWVYLLAQRLGDAYDRPVTIHDWSIDTDSYSGQTQVGDGGNAPIVVWNGSAVGKGADYSLAHLGVMAPATPDLVVVNHGHNQPSAAVARRDIANLTGRAVQAWGRTTAVAVVLQNPRLDGNAERQAQVVDVVREVAAADPSILTVDVYAAFQAQPDVSALLNADGFHPNPDGERVWADAVAAALGVP